MKQSKEEKRALVEEAKQDKKDLQNWDKFIERMKEKGALVIEDTRVKKQSSPKKPPQNQPQTLKLNL